MPPQAWEFPSRADGADTASQLSTVESTSPQPQTDGSSTKCEMKLMLIEIQVNVASGSSSESVEFIEGISPGEVEIMMELMRCLVGATEQKKEGLPVQPVRLQFCTLMTQAKVAESCFDRLGDAEYIVKAVECRRRVLSLIPDGHEARRYQLATFGKTLIRKFECLGDLADIEQAIQCLSEVIHITDDSDPSRRRWLYNLGTSYIHRFERLGELEDANKAIECQAQAVQLTPEGRPDKPGGLNNLGTSYLRQFERRGELADLFKAIEWQTQAVQLTPDGHPHKPGRLDNLGISFMRRFEHLGQLADVDKAIESQTQAVQLTTEGHPDKSIRLNNLGTSYMSRFERLGKLEDVDKAIECQTQAVQLTPDGHPDKPSRFNNLGTSYKLRFQRLGELADVDKAIECQTRAVRLAPDGHPDKPNQLTNLGNSFIGRFERLGGLEDVDNAIECLSQAVRLTPDDHRYKPAGLNNLGISYKYRFERLGELADANKAIECHTQALQLTPDGHPDKPSGLSNLGTSYMRRFERLGELADVDKGIECQTQAVQLTPDGHSDRPSHLKNLGISYIGRFHSLGKRSDLTRAQSLFEQGAQLALTNPESQLSCARKWAKASSLLGLSPQEAYERCIKLLPHLIWLGTTINHRYSLLTQVNDLATEAASWAISVQSYDLAIEWLEEGRSIVWNQILQLRTPFDHLSTVDPQLAQKLTNIANKLENAASRQAAQGSLIDMKSDLETAAQHHRRLAAEWERCIEQARSIPGFHNFMQPRSAAELKSAAADGAVIIINTHSMRWDALIIFPQCDDVVRVPLGKPPVNEAGRSHARPYSGCISGHRGDPSRGLKLGHAKQGAETGSPFRSALVALWLEVVKPILDALGYTAKISVDELPRVTWCATGSLASIPLHAAGPYDGLSPNTFDLVISSYAPSLSALLSMSAMHPQPEMELLAIAQEYTKGLCPLPNTVQELEAIKTHAHTTGLLQLTGEKASVNAVLNAMGRHGWVHLACHATQNPVNPAHSAFHLFDGDLTLETINKRQFRNKGLAFLSACQTAKGDGKLPDEAVHLAAGMLMAGYPSVIATMWSIWDADGPEVAGRVYAELLDGGKMDHRGAARALHKAVAGLREQIGEDKFERWMPFIHLGV